MPANLALTEGPTGFSGGEKLTTAWLDRTVEIATVTTAWAKSYRTRRGVHVGRAAYRRSIGRARSQATGRTR